MRMHAILDGLGDNDEVFFGSGDLSYYRHKDVGPKQGPRLVNFQFNEVYTVNADPGEG